MCVKLFLGNLNPTIALQRATLHKHLSIKYWANFMELEPWGCRPKYLLGLGHCLRRYSGMRIDQ